MKYHPLCSQAELRKRQGHGSPLSCVLKALLSVHRSRMKACDYTYHTFYTRTWAVARLQLLPFSFHSHFSAFQFCRRYQSVAKRVIFRLVISATDKQYDTLDGQHKRN
mmetsp:Transcript_19217/g.49226  ORF Transcript_19217/g.49226 Transcript_19217/m.49226 type:complete len:108 (+) Transcript_19217:2673-2996(+)